MGTNRGEEVKYRCNCDCSQSGCPGHTMRMDENRTSDTIIFVKDGVEVYWFDENEWDAMQTAERLHAMKNGWDMRKFDNVRLGIHLSEIREYSSQDMESLAPQERSVFTPTPKVPQEVWEALEAYDGMTGALGVGAVHRTATSAGREALVDVPKVVDKIASKNRRPKFEFDKNSFRPLRDGKPCWHPGCLNHVSHPCEGCGRVGGRYVLPGEEGKRDE